MRGKIAGDRFYIEDREVSEAAFWRAFPPVKEFSSEALIGWKPILSDAAAVHPRQVKEATESARRKGVPTEFLPDGRPVFTSRGHRRRYLRAYGFHDRSGGYGD